MYAEFVLYIACFAALCGWCAILTMCKGSAEALPVLRLNL